MMNKLMGYLEKTKRNNYISNYLINNIMIDT